MNDKFLEKDKCKSIAIMGGTFDPIHYGHLATAEAVRIRYGIEKVLFIPTGSPPHKDINMVTENNLRYEMTVLATKSNENFEVSRIEMDRPGRTYTIDTLIQLNEIYGDDVKLYFIMGADVIDQIFMWKDSAKVLKLCNFIGVTRPGYKKREIHEQIESIRKNYGSSISFMEVPALDISSSDIRLRVKSGLSIKYLLPENVEKFILKNSLYINNIFAGENKMLDFKVMQEKLQSSLSIKRYIHTMGVADEAVKLAEVFGGENEKLRARAAGLLHDCAKDYPTELKKRLCKEYHIEIDDIMEKQPDLIHQFLGAEVAKREYLVSDEDILNAVKYHTTGRRRMSLLEKIVFVADYIEPGRKSFEGLNEARNLAYTDINKAMSFILKQTIEHLNEKNKLIHPLSLEAYEYYKNK